MEGLNFEPVLRRGVFCTGPQNIGYLFGLGCSDTNWETKHVSFFRVSFFFSLCDLVGQLSGYLTGKPISAL